MDNTKTESITIKDKEYQYDLMDLSVNVKSLHIIDLYNLWTLKGLEKCKDLTELYIEGAYSLSNVSSIEKLQNLKSLKISDCDDIVPAPIEHNMNTRKKVEYYQQMLKDIYSNGKIIVKDIVDRKIDTDDLGQALEYYAESIEDFGSHYLLLNITKKELVNQNFDNLDQVGYLRDYGNRDQLNSLMIWYYTKCRGWYIHADSPFPSDENALKEAQIIWDDEKKYPDHSNVIFLYCEGEYAYCINI